MVGVQLGPCGSAGLPRPNPVSSRHRINLSFAIYRLLELTRFDLDCTVRFGFAVGDGVLPFQAFEATRLPRSKDKQDG
jgi:hypothetical protein